MKYTVDIENKKIVWHPDLPEGHREALKKVFGPKGYQFDTSIVEELENSKGLKGIHEQIEEAMEDMKKNNSGKTYIPNTTSGLPYDTLPHIVTNSDHTSDNESKFLMGNGNYVTADELNSIMEQEPHPYYPNNKNIPF